ncbi:endo-1,4-beta-xylanase [Polaribacter sp. PL03]|uniref:endo-1,4-beta-xylanase n=1 Tax=Polaribacter sp. PL03 TaxID=3088353 RepID=UPI0029D11EAD|nr:endo-1,4-beta-xylanase [Polaribacter sp. PL03]MDX6746629.1 endo-1,4-beta-xylanase [Polaribacter sp. PL03]
MFNKISTTLLLVSICFLSCKETKKEAVKETPQDITSLQNSFKEDFLIGTALNTGQIKEVDSVQTALITREFNAITPENDLKWEQIHPKKDTYNFDVSDAYVAFGNKNNMHVVGHTLLWHSQLAPWVHEITNKDTLVNNITKHINTIAGRYKGKIDSWDVVNEALNEDGSPRESIFYKLFGDESYLELAFKLAEKAAPDAELVYNDYNLWKPAKREGVIRVVKNLQAKGIKVDGVGMQAHWSLEGPSLEDIENSIIAYSDLGVKVMFTELDITVLPNPWELDGAAVEQSYESYENDPKMNPYPNGLTEEVELKIAKRYEDIFNLFLKHKDKISRVTFWGVNDGQSWLNNWPIKGRTNYPLLFGRDDKPKEVYNNVIALKNKAN